MAITRVVLADDHAAVRAGIRSLLKRAEDIEIVGEASNGIEAVRVTQDLVPDVLLLDMEMPGLMGIEVARKLRSNGTPVSILAVSAHQDKQYILGMLDVGAAGYLTKEEVPETLLKAVRGVANGERGWVSRRVAAQIAVWAREDNLGRFGLNNQEIEVLRLQVNGKNNEQIAEALRVEQAEVEGIVESAVQTIRDGLMKRYRSD